MIKAIFACLAVAALGAASASIAFGTPPFLASGSPPVRGTIEQPFKVELNGVIKVKTKAALDVVDQTVTIQPGGNSGWHGHPGPVLVVVKAGTVTFYEADDPTCTPHSFSAGQALVDSGSGHLARNQGSVPVELSFTYLLPAGAPFRTDLADPGYCSA